MQRITGTGVTLVELMVTLAILAVLLAIALPSMREFIARKRLEGTAQELMTDLRMLKSHQLQNRPSTGTVIGFGANAQKTCYMLYVKGTIQQGCDCGLADNLVCGAPDAGGLLPVPIRQVNIPLDSGITVAADRPFLEMRGYNAMPLLDRKVSVTLTSATAGEIRVSTNETGMPSICSVSGAFGAIEKCRTP
ncbi:MAG: prepilin-type N-terminal cleavage/methylation domain-containing protein [Aquabacterium sp.]|nr:prepilin-type N-terminal cleavage/methylation domain-containing protein [Aquabacterium sp.]